MKWICLGLILGIFQAQAGSGPPPYTIVTFGDSLTAPREKLKVYFDWLAERLISQNVRVVNLGHPGDTTSAGLLRFSTVLAEHPNLVIIQFGVNDSAIDVWKKPPETESRVSLEEYDQNLRHFIREIRQSGGEVILMTPSQLRWTDLMRKFYGHKPVYDPDDERGFLKYLSQYVERMRQIAQEENVVIVDIYALYDQWEKTTKRSASTLLIDGVHPNNEGQKLVADALEPVVRKIRDTSPK